MQNQHKKYAHAGILIFAFVCIFIYIVFSFLSNNSETKIQKEIAIQQKQKTSSLLKLNKTGKLFNVLLSDTDELRQKGLGGRQSIDTDDVMLFVFNNDAKHFFWMKDMLFPIDIVWLDKEKKVIFIEQNVAPETYPKAFGPQVDSRYVLEFQAGTIKREKISLDDQVTLE